MGRMDDARGFLGQAGAVLGTAAQIAGKGAHDRLHEAGRAAEIAFQKWQRDHGQAVAEEFFRLKLSRLVPILKSVKALAAVEGVNLSDDAALNLTLAYQPQLAEAWQRKFEASDDEEIRGIIANVQKATEDFQRTMGGVPPGAGFFQG